MGNSRYFFVQNIQFIKRVSEYAGSYALYFRALVPLRFQLNASVPMLNCISCTSNNNIIAYLSGISLYKGSVY